MNKRRVYKGLIAAVMLGLSPAAFGQDVIVETLGAATAFDAGALSTDDVSLPSTLWQNTSAARAAEVMKAAPKQSEDPIIRAMVRAALLSGGVPPQGERDDFESARMQAVMAMGDKTALDTFMSRNPALGQTPTARVNLALAAADWQSACAVSDSITEGRALPEWARLRAVCHMLREEGPAAELTLDLLQSSGFEDRPYFALLSIMGGSKRAVPAPSAQDDSLVRFMRAHVSTEITKATALDRAAPDADRLKALWLNLTSLTSEQLTTIMSDLAFDEDDLAGSSSYDLTAAMASQTPQTTAQLYQLARSGNPKALSELVKRSGGQAAPLMAMMQNDIAAMPADQQAQADLKLFAHAAVTRRDIAALQGLYAAAEAGSENQARIALAADALGNGYTGGPLGKDIDARLQSSGLAVNRARRDAALALALGAQLSDAANDALSGQAFHDGGNLSGGDRVIIGSAANNGSLAELTLRIASALDGPKLNTDSLAFLIATLSSSGLTEFAGQLAARDFLDGLS